MRKRGLPSHRPSLISRFRAHRTPETPVATPGSSSRSAGAVGPSLTSDPALRTAFSEGRFRVAKPRHPSSPNSPRIAPSLGHFPRARQSPLFLGPFCCSVPVSLLCVLPLPSPDDVFITDPFRGVYTLSRGACDVFTKEMLPLDLLVPPGLILHSALIPPSEGSTLHSASRVGNLGTILSLVLLIS